MEGNAHIIQFRKGEEVKLNYVGTMNGADVYEHTVYFYDAEFNEKTVFTMRAEVIPSLTRRERLWAVFNNTGKYKTIQNEDGTLQQVQIKEDGN